MRAVLATWHYRGCRDTMATMPPTRKNAIALLTTAVGLGIVLVAGVMLYRPLEERYWLCIFRSAARHTLALR